MTLISILGDVHSSILPIFYEFSSKLTMHIIVYDPYKSKNNYIDALLDGQIKFAERHDSKYTPYRLETFKVNENDQDSIMTCYEYLKSHNIDFKDVYLNAGGDLGSIGLVLSSHILNAGGSVVVYDKYDNNYNLHTYNSMQHKEIQNNMDILTHLNLKGYKTNSYSRRNDLKKRKSHILTLTKDLKEYKRFADKLQNTPLKKLKGYGQFKSAIGQMDSSITTKVFLQGAVFEEYIYHLLVDNFDFDDVMTSVELNIEENVMNEFDILMIKDNHLHTIECKLRAKVSMAELIYKSKYTLDYLDDEGKAMILNISGDKNANLSTVSDIAEARAKRARIKIYKQEWFNEQHFLKAVREWFCV